MNLKITNIIKYLYRWKIRILVVVVLAVLMANMYVNRIQTYSSQTIIRFNDSSISEGNFPDGTTFDVNDISSPKVIQKALDNLNIDYTVDNIRSCISVSSIIPDSVETVKEAQEDAGEEYEYYPTTYTVTYSGISGQNIGDVRNILDEVVLEYITYYAEKYASYAVVDNAVADNDIMTYDYIERADIMNDNISSILTSLEGYNSTDDSFRSALTGMSFSDLIYEYNHLKNFTMSRLYANIYKGKVAQNKDLVIERYLEKQQEMNLRCNNYTDMANMTKKQMDAFADANKDIPNAYNTSDSETNDDNVAIIDDVHRYSEEYRTKVKTTYDTLMNNYTDQLVAANNAKLDAEHYRKVADIFSEQAEAGTDTAALEEDIKQTIDSTITKMNELYTTTKQTIDDYNDKSASKNISLLTGVRCYENVSSSLYVLVAFVLSFGFMVVLAISFEMVRAYKKEEEIEGAAAEKKKDGNSDDDAPKPDNNEGEEKKEAPDALTKANENAADDENSDDEISGSESYDGDSDEKNVEK